MNLGSGGWGRGCIRIPLHCSVNFKGCLLISCFAMFVSCFIMVISYIRGCCRALWLCGTFCLFGSNRCHNRMDCYIYYGGCVLISVFSSCCEM